MKNKVYRLILNYYVSGLFSHGFDIGFCFCESKANSIIEKLKKKQKDEKIIGDYVFEKRLEKPVSIRRMKLRAISEMENQEVDYIDNDTVVGNIYDVSLVKRSQEFNFLINLGLLFTDLSDVKEIEKKLVGNDERIFKDYYFEIRKAENNSFQKVNKKVEEIIF